MKFRLERHRVTDEEERSLAAEVRRLHAASTPADQSSPSEAYWQNLIVRTNARIDRATGGRALSISWAARVAVPGVVAIVSFLIALHYYVPESPNTEISVSTVVHSLPPAAIDSMLVDPSQVQPGVSVADLGGDVFEIAREEIADYLVVSGNATAAVEGMTEKETSELLAVLSSGEDGR